MVPAAKQQWETSSLKSLLMVKPEHVPAAIPPLSPILQAAPARLSDMEMEMWGAQPRSAPHTSFWEERRSPKHFLSLILFTWDD